MRRLIAFQQGMEMARLAADKQLDLGATTDSGLINVPYGEPKHTGIFITMLEPDVYRFVLSQGLWGIRIEGAVTLFPRDLVERKESILIRRYGKK